MNIKYLESRFFSLVSDKEPASYSNIESSASGCINILSFNNGSISQSIRNNQYILFTRIEDLPKIFSKLFTEIQYSRMNTHPYVELFTDIFEDKKIAYHFISKLLAK
jgi:hypothetical protein